MKNTTFLIILICSQFSGASQKRFDHISPKIEEANSLPDLEAFELLRGYLGETGREATRPNPDPQYIELLSRIREELAPRTGYLTPTIDKVLEEHLALAKVFNKLLVKDARFQRIAELEENKRRGWAHLWKVWYADVATGKEPFQLKGDEKKQWLNGTGYQPETNSSNHRPRKSMLRVTSDLPPSNTGSKPETMMITILFISLFLSGLFWKITKMDR